MTEASGQAQSPAPLLFIAAAATTALIAGVSAALCIAIDVPVWAMFAGWIAFVTGGGRAVAGAVALGSVLLGLALGLCGALAIGAGAALAGFAVPVIVFIVTFIAVSASMLPVVNSVIGYFIGMTVWFASALSPELPHLVTLAIPVIIGAASGLAAMRISSRITA